MIGYVLIGLWTLFSLYMTECKLFGTCVVSKGVEKTCFNLNLFDLNAYLSYPINLILNRQGSREGHKPSQLSNEPSISD